MVSAGCSPARAPGDSDKASHYLFVWAGDPDVGDSDFLAVIELSDPRHPVVVDELEFGDRAVPHWISLEPSGNRIVLTGGGTLSGQVVMLRIDPESGKLSVIEDFGGGRVPGVNMDRADWPHGSSGAVRPHGAVFSRS